MLRIMEDSRGLLDPSVLQGLYQSHVAVGKMVPQESPSRKCSMVERLIWSQHEQDSKVAAKFVKYFQKIQETFRTEPRINLPPYALPCHFCNNLSHELTHLHSQSAPKPTPRTDNGPRLHLHKQHYGCTALGCTLRVCELLDCFAAPRIVARWRHKVFHFLRARQTP